MGKSRAASGQTKEQQLAVRIIKDLKEWASVGADNWEKNLPKGYRPNHCLGYRFSIHNKLWMESIRLKLLAEGKDGLAKEIEQKRDELNAKVEDYDKNLDPTHPMHLPSFGLSCRAGNLVNTLESALPYLGAQPAKGEKPIAPRGQNNTAETRKEEPYHRMKNPSGQPLAKALQMQINLESQFYEALQGIPKGREYMLKLAEVMKGFANETISDDLEYFCLNHPQPFSSRVSAIQQLSDDLFWWMRRNNLSGVVDPLERNLNHIASIARQLDSSSPPPPGITPDAKPEKLYARHVPLNAELMRLVHRLCDVASAAKPRKDNVGKAGETKQRAKEPSKEANQAYQLYYGMGVSQRDVANTMSEKLKRPIKQWQVSRWTREVKNWRKANNLPIDVAGKKPTMHPVDPEGFDVGERTDGRGSGDPRHRRDSESNQ